MSRLEQRRAQQQNLIRSVVLAGLGILAIALVLVPGQSFWNVLRSWLFGTFGVVTYFVGPFLLYLAYLLASGYHVGTFIGKVLLLAVLLAGTAVIFSDFKVGDTPWQTVKMLFAWGQRKFWTGGVLGVPIGASLLAVCGRPGANIVMIIVILMGLMVFLPLPRWMWCSSSAIIFRSSKPAAPPVRRKKPLMIPSCLAMKRRKNPLKT
ncbi:MAG: hypothetical protein ACLUOB_12735 [Subdoligranulum sp.]